MFDWLFGKKRKKEEELEQIEKKDQLQAEGNKISSILTQFNPGEHWRQMVGYHRSHLHVKDYQSFIDTLKTIPKIDINDPRLPPALKKYPIPFSEMLGAIEEILGTNPSQRDSIQVEVHNDTFVFITDRKSEEFEIAKLNDDSYLFISTRDRTTDSEPLYYKQTNSTPKEIVEEKPRFLDDEYYFTDQNNGWKVVYDSNLDKELEDLNIMSRHPERLLDGAVIILEDKRLEHRSAVAIGNQRCPACKKTFSYETKRLGAFGGEDIRCSLCGFRFEIGFYAEHDPERYYLYVYTYVGKPYDIHKVPKPTFYIKQIGFYY
jgi:hypothetical protein